jgi:hypothetical protein
MTAYRPSSETLPLASAVGLVSDLGFLAGPDIPDRPGPAYLLVALRDHPTLRHYDPERIDYWVSRKGRGTRGSLTRATPMPLDGEFSWGLIRLVDRLDVTNEYVTFGGHLSAAPVESATIVVFSSPVPLLRRGGHSQVWDAGADELSAFFARLVAAIDLRPELERVVCDADPLVRYSAFLADVAGRYRSSPALRHAEARVWSLLRGEESRMRGDHAPAWKEGRELLDSSRRALGRMA